MEERGHKQETALDPVKVAAKQNHTGCADLQLGMQNCTLGVGVRNKN